MMGIGDLQRSIDQKNLDTAYGDFVEQRDYPWTQLNRLQSMGANNPLNRATTQTQTSPGPNTWAQLIGGALGVGGILSNTGAFGKNGWLTGGSNTAGGLGDYGIINSGTDQFGGDGGWSDIIDAPDLSGLGDYMDYGTWGYGV